MAYDLSAELQRAATILAREVEEFSHLDVSRMLFALARTRAKGRHGMHATCQPLRFESGETSLMINSEEWIWPPVIVGGQEMLYAVTAYVPRFLNVSSRDKVETLVHELYHVSPFFNGDIRRLGRGRNAAHGKSRAFFDRLIAPLVKEAIPLLSPDDFPFVALNADQLSERFDGIVGQRYKGLRPRRASPS